MTKRWRIHFLLRLFILLFLASYAPLVRSDQTAPISSSLRQSESIKAQAGSDSEPPADVFITDQGLSPPVVTISAGDTIRWMNQTNQTVQVESTSISFIYLPLIFKGDGEVKASNGVSNNGLSASSTLPSQDAELQSGNILPNEIFSHTFEQPGEYSYTLVGTPGLPNNLGSSSTPSGTIIVVSTTEGLGPANISFEEPVSGFVAAGTGLNSQSGTINIDVPEGATIKKVLLYWSGATVGNNPGDATIEVSNPSQTEIVTGDLIGGPHFFYTPAYFSSFRADITDLDLVGTGSNTLTIDEMSFGQEDHGAGVLVIYDDGFNTANLQIRDGLDLAFFGFPEPRKTTIPQTFTFPESDFEQTAKLLFFVGSIGGSDRPNSIEITIDGPTIDSSTTVLVNPLESADGSQWDSLTVPISIPAGATSLTVEVISTNSSNPLGASLAWITAALSISPGADLVLTKSADPDPVAAGESLTYELNIANNGPSSATGVIVTDNLPDEVSFVSVTPTPECSETNGTVTCNLGNLAANDTATVTIEVTVDPLATGSLSNSASVESENDPIADNNSDDEEIAIVAVRLILEPQQATNQVGNPHDITATLQFDDGGGGFQDAVAATGDINFALNSGPGDITLSCTPTTGSCTSTLTSDTTGESQVSAEWSGTLDIGGGVILSVASPVTASATKSWVDALLTLSPPEATNNVGDDHIITAKLQIDSGDGGGLVDVEGEVITFVIDESSTTGSILKNPAECTTDANGECTITLQSETIGVTNVTAEWSGTLSETPISASASASKSWVDALLTLSPAEAANNVGDDHIITAKLQVDGVDVEGEVITFVIDESSTAGSILENPAECTTDTNGECTITLQSETIGVTNVTAEWSGTLSESPISASASATKSWIEVQLVLSPEAAANQVGVDNPHEIEAILQFDDGSGFQDVVAATGDINFILDSGPGDMTLSCTPTTGSCIGTLTSDNTGESQVSAEWSGTVDIGGGVIASVASLINAGPVSKTWVDALLTLEVITGSDIGTSILDQHTIQATLEFDFGDGAGFVSAPAGEQIDFSVVSGPGILQVPEFCITLADGTCTINLDFDPTSLDLGGIVNIEAIWTGNIDTTAGGDPVTASASASTSVEATFFSVQATIIDEASEIECDPAGDVPNSVFGPNGLDPSGTGTNFNIFYEIPSLVFEPNGDQAVVFNCLFDDEDVDIYWMAPTDRSREVYIGMTTNGQANYDIAVFVDLHLGDGDIKLEAVSLIDTQSVDSSGSMSSGSMSSGSMSSGSMSSGSMSSGSMSSGSMSSGSMSSGSMSSGSMSSGSFNSGNVDERAAAHIEAGQTVFIAVLSQAGDFGPEYEMRVDVLNTDEGECTWSPQFDTTITPPSLPDGTNKKTGFFINIGRFEATYGAARTQALLDALQNPLFLNDSTVQGIVVPIEQDSAVATTYTNWNADYCRIAKANAVAEAVRNLIVDDYGDLEQIVIVGGPEMIPPYLVMEGPVEISPESDYEFDSQADADSPLRWWLKQNRVPTYDIYVDNNGPFIRYLGNNLYQPEKPIGVLVETPENIIEVINNYNAAGLQPQSCLNTGYEHLTDAAQAIDGLINLPTQSLISEQWTATDVLNAFATNPELVSFNGHFEHWRALPAAGSELVYAPEIVSNLITNQVGASMGCHAGLNMPNDWVSTAQPTPQGFHPRDDFAEVLLGNGWASWYATMPYAYGDDEAFKYTEQIMFNFFKALDSSSGGATVGQAYVSSKQEYFAQMAAGDFDIYDIKSLRGAVLYGLPFQHVSIPLSVALDTLDPTISPAQKAALLAYPDVDLGAFVTQSEPVKIPYSRVSLYASNQIFNLEQIDTLRGSYLRKVGGNNTDVVVSPGRPLQPLVSVDLSGQPHGATLVSASYHDLTNFDPIVTNPATDTVRFESLLSKNRWFPPSDGLWAVNLLGSTPRLNMIPAQYNTNGRIERVYDTMDLEIFESSSDSFHPPGIWNPNTTCEGNDVTFEVKVDDADGIQMVNVAYNDTANSMWQTTANLTVSPHPDDDGSFLATGTFALGPGVEYFIQAVDNDGNVNFDSNFGTNYLTCTHPPDATNNFLDSGENTHTITIELEINFGVDWETFPGVAQVSGLLFSEGLGDVEVLNCDAGFCTIQISGVNINGQTSLIFNDEFDVQPGEIGEGGFVPIGDLVQGSLSGDTPSSFVKEWWSGSVAVFKQVHSNADGEVCFTLSGSAISNDTQCISFAGPSDLLFTWDNLPSGDDYAVMEAPPPAPLVGGGVIDDDIILDEGHRHALVRTVNNRDANGCDPFFWRNHLELWVVDPDTSFASIFGVELSGHPGISLKDTINLSGDGFNKLARHGVAAFLDASFGPIDNSALNFAYTPSEVIQITRDAIIGNSPEPALSQLLAATELVCPLDVDQNGEEGE